MDGFSLVGYQEAQLISEKRILERRVAELRLAYDQQQKGLVDAASQALSYRQEILEENIRLTYALQVAEQERGFYVQSLMPLLAEFDLQPAVSDAHSMVSHIKILVQKLRSELELMEVPILPLSDWKQYITP
jgi:multidrug efflux pump subunit AcrA (membrane-fusion protein)